MDGMLLRRRVWTSFDTALPRHPSIRGTMAPCGVATRPSSVAGSADRAPYSVVDRSWKRTGSLYQVL